MLEVNKKLQLCVVGNFILLLFIILLFIFFGNSESNYWRFRPSETLIIINVKINNYFKYCMLLLIISEFTSIFTIRLLLNEKNFKKNCKDETEEEELTELVNV